MSDEQNKSPDAIDQTLDLMRAGVLGKAIEHALGDDVTTKELQDVCNKLRGGSITEFTSQNVGDILEAITCGRAEGKSSVKIELGR